MSVTAHETSKSDTKRDRASKTRRFFASELPWFLIFVWFCWTFALGPALAKAGDSMAILVHMRNDLAEPVFIVAAAPRLRGVASLTLKPGEDRWVRVAGGDGYNFWDQTVTVSAYADDGSLAKRWEGPASEFAASGPNARELIIESSDETQEPTP